MRAARRAGSQAETERRSTLRRFSSVVQRHPVLTVFVIALSVRLIAATAMDIVLERSLILDDTGYMRLAAEAASGADAAWEPSKHVQYARNGVFLVPLTVLFEVFGPVPLIGQWMVACLGAAVAAATARLAMELVERSWALAAGLVVGLLPSQVFFTSLTLKDGFVWTAMSLIGLGIALAGRQRSLATLLLWLSLCGILLLALAGLRAHTAVIAAWALFLASWFGHRSRLAPRVALALALCVAVPWMAGLGPAGVGFVRNLSPVEEYRQAQATGNTPIITPTTAIFEQPFGGGIPDDLALGGRSAEELIPDDPTSGAQDNTTRPLSGADGADAGWYPTESSRPEFSDRQDPAGSSFGRDLRHLPRGLAVMLVEPHPFRSAPNRQVWLAKAEMLIWYPLLGLALLGLIAAAKALPQAGRAIFFPVLVAAGSLFAAALAEGNFGTAYRHRGEFVWVVGLLAAVGLRSLWLRRLRVSAPPGLVNVITEPS